MSRSHTALVFLLEYGMLVGIRQGSGITAERKGLAPACAGLTKVISSGVW